MSAILADAVVDTVVFFLNLAIERRRDQTPAGRQAVGSAAEGLIDRRKQGGIGEMLPWPKGRTERQPVERPRTKVPDGVDGGIGEAADGR